jgi:hypothetical protein
MFVLIHRFCRINTEQSRHDIYPAAAARSTRNSAQGRLVCKWHCDAAQRRSACTWRLCRRELGNLSNPPRSALPENGALRDLPCLVR